MTAAAVALITVSLSVLHLPLKRNLRDAGNAKLQTGYAFNVGVTVLKAKTVKWGPSEGQLSLYREFGRKPIVAIRRPFIWA